MPKQSRLANRTRMSGTCIRSNPNTDRGSVFGGLLYQTSLVCRCFCPSDVWYLSDHCNKNLGWDSPTRLWLKLALGYNKKLTVVVDIGEFHPTRISSFVVRANYTSALQAAPHPRCTQVFSNNNQVLSSGTIFTNVKVHRQERRWLVRLFVF
jgi:hypothetical protein